MSSDKIYTEDFDELDWDQVENMVEAGISRDRAIKIIRDRKDSDYGKY